MIQQHLFLDVATHNTGAAIFGESSDGSVTLRRYGLIRGGGSSVSMEERCGTIAKKVMDLCTNSLIRHAYLEFPTFQAGTRGLAAARGGDTLQLAYLCGVIGGMLHTRGIESTLITFREWGGQVTKTMTCQRLKRHLNIEANPKSVANNYADAIMMGYWWFTQRTHLPILEGQRTGTFPFYL